MKVTRFITWMDDIGPMLQRSGGWVGFAGPDLPTPILVRIAPSEDGRPTCVGLILGVEVHRAALGRQSVEVSLGNAEITSRALHELSISSYFREHVDAFMKFEVDYPKAQRRKHRRPGLAGIDRDELRDFAEFYTKVRAGTTARSIVPLVARRRNISESTVRRWVKRAQAEGLMPKDRVRHR